MLLQKEFISDPISKQRKKNRGELPQYYVENTHPAIIDKATFDYVQEEIARRKELGALANKSLNNCCFTGKIRCPHCGVSYMHSRRTKNGHFQEYWNCGTKKKKKVGDGCPVGGTVNHRNLTKVCAEALGLDAFEKDVFLERIDHIDVPKKYTLEFFFKDGTCITKDCPNTGHQDCWTEEYRARTSEKRRKNPTCIKSSVLTEKIKCAKCGCNFRRAAQPSSTAESGKAYYWRCAEHNGCETVGLREDVLKPVIADVLGIDEFNDTIFDERIDYIDMLSAAEMVFHFKDGGTASRTWEQPKRTGRPWTDEQRAKFHESIKGRYTPEVRQQMSEYMKQLRKERGKAWRKEK